MMQVDYYFGEFLKELGLSAQAKRVLLVKRMEINEAWNKAANAHNAKKQAEILEVPLNELPESEQFLVREYREVSARLTVLQKNIDALPYSVFRDSDPFAPVRRKENDHDVRRRAIENDREYNAIRKTAEVRVEALKEVAKKMAKNEIAQVRLKLDSTIIAELDAL